MYKFLLNVIIVTVLITGKLSAESENIPNKNVDSEKPNEPREPFSSESPLPSLAPSLHPSESPSVPSMPLSSEAPQVPSEPASSEAPQVPSEHASSKEPLVPSEHASSKEPLVPSEPASSQEPQTPSPLTDAPVPVIPTVVPSAKDETTQDPSTTEEPIITTDPVTTVEPTSTVSPLPSKHNFYNVTTGNVVCVMFVGEFSFSVTYSIEGNKTNETVVSLPKPGTEDVDVAGSCKSNRTQWIKVSWGSTFPKTSMRLNFKNINNNTWIMNSMRAIISVDNSTFVNATDSGKLIKASYNMTRLTFSSGFNHSYQCYAELKDTNGTITMENRSYPYPVTASMKAIQLQAFNRAADVDSFVHATHCSEDKIADLVPIGVGCALAALIIFVLIAYVVGRRRRNLAYQAV